MYSIVCSNRESVPVDGERGIAHLTDDRNTNLVHKEQP